MAGRGGRGGGERRRRRGRGVELDKERKKLRCSFRLTIVARKEKAANTFG